MTATPGRQRARIDATRALEYQGAALLRCPRCAGPAWSRTTDAAAPALFAPRRLVCGACAYIAEWTGPAIRRADGANATDDYFHLPVFLQTPCCGELLWAYHPAHLDVLSEWLNARLRERRRSPQHGWSNRSFWSRLPRWIKQPRHRDEVAAALRRLHAMAAPLRPNVADRQTPHPASIGE